MWREKDAARGALSRPVLEGALGTPRAEAAAAAWEKMEARLEQVLVRLDRAKAGLQMKPQAPAQEPREEAPKALPGTITQEDEEKEKRVPGHSNITKMKRQRNTQQVKEQEKCPPNQTKEEEVGNLPEKEFRILIVKMIQNLEIKMESQINSLETRIEKMQERFNKDLEEIKKSQNIMNNAINEIRNTLETTNNRIMEAEDRISEIEDRMVEINESERKKEK